MEEEDLARAIALSLQDAPPAGTEARETGAAGDPDVQFEAELQRALELSKSLAPVHPPAAAPASSSNAFLSERAQLEKARLERQKRLRGDIDADGDTVARRSQSRSQSRRSSDGDGEYDSDDGELERSPPAKRPHVQSLPTRAQPRAGPSNGAQTGNSVEGAEGELFWDGELRQTANPLADPAKDRASVFRISDIIGPKSEIQLALLASYCIDWSWLYAFFAPGTPVVVAAQPDESGNQSLKEVLPNWIKTTPFLRAGRGCMHMKFMLLFYKSGRLRVVVSTANFVPYDWREIENTVWVQDVPRRPAAIPRDRTATDFPATFERVLSSLNVERALTTLQFNGHPALPLPSVPDLRTHWDFARVRVQLVASLAGKHEGWPTVVRTGHPALMKAVRDVGARATRDVEVVLECQGSSIGTYSTQWTNEFYTSACGASAEEWLDAPRTRRAKLPWPPVRIVFPSLATVRASRLGESGGGTIFCRRNQWEAAKFPRELFHDSRSKRGGVLMHSKMIIATFRPKATLTATAAFASASSSAGKAKAKARRRDERDSESETESDTDDEVQIIDAPGASKPPAAPARGWAYVGSHNFTPSAWGTLSGSAFNPVLNIVNFELGIVSPLASEAEADRVACWERPPRKYVAGKDKPWMQDESEAQKTVRSAGTQ